MRISDIVLFLLRGFWSSETLYGISLVGKTVQYLRQFKYTNLDVAKLRAQSYAARVERSELRVKLRLTTCVCI